MRKSKKEKHGKSNQKHRKEQLFYRILSIVLGIVSIIFTGILFYIDLLPTKYISLIMIVLLIFNLINILLLNYRILKRKIKRFISVIVIIAILIMSIASFYLGRTIGVLVSNGDSKYKLENYSVIVLKESNYTKVSDIENKNAGYYEKSTGVKDAQDYMKKKVNVQFKSYSASDSLAGDLLEKKIDAILVEESIKNIMYEELEGFADLVTVIDTFPIKIKVESVLKDVNVTKDSFAIYISGIDTYGKISSVSRSDVNIVAVVNPSTKQILLISIPRDYYVQLHGTTGNKDKLTHAGIYGIDMSIQTIEDLLDTDINYYVKVNFTSVIDIVDALGNLELYSEYTFISYSGYSFKKGYNTVDGKQALDFARTRKAFKDGDRQRGKNQQALIEALIRKATNKSIITKYNSLLSAVDGKYQTNMSAKKITSLIKMQLNDMSPWNITSYSLTGTDSNNYTYTYNQLLYVMEPDKNSVEGAQKLIDQVLAGEKLDSSYGEVSGNINKVNQVQTQQPTEQEPPKVQEPEEKPNENNEPNNPQEKDPEKEPGEDKKPDNPQEKDPEENPDNKDPEEGNEKNPQEPDENEKNPTPNPGNNENPDNDPIIDIMPSSEE